MPQPNFRASVPSPLRVFPPYSLISHDGGGIDSINLGDLSVILSVPINSNGAYGKKLSANLQMASGFPLVLSGGIVQIGHYSVLQPQSPADYPASVSRNAVRNCVGSESAQGVVDHTGAFHWTPAVQVSSGQNVMSAPGRNGWQIGSVWEDCNNGHFVAVAPDGTYSWQDGFYSQFGYDFQTLVDEHGNAAKYSQYAAGGQVFTDAAQNQVLITGASGGLPPGWIRYPGPNGTTPQWTPQYQVLTLNSGANCAAYHTQYVPQNPQYFTKSLQLPDGSSYYFGYENYWNTTNVYTGRISSITLPTGAAIVYQYSGGTNGQGVWCDDGSGATIKKATPDGTWVFTHCEYGLATAPTTCNAAAPTGWSANRLATTTVTAPSGDYKIYTTVAYIPTDPGNKRVLPIHMQSFGTTGPGCSVSSPCDLGSQTICYNGHLGLSTCLNPTGVVTGAITERDVYNYTPGIASPSLTVYMADSSERPIETRVYGFGGTRTATNWDSDVLTSYGSWNGSSCAPVTGTIFGTSLTYQVMNRVCSKQAFVGGGTTPVSTSYFTYNATGDLVTQQDTIGGALVTTATNTYDSFGRLTSTTGPNGEQTTAAYSACSGTEPSSRSVKTGTGTSLTSYYTSYDCTGERLLTKQDPNGNPSSTDYGTDPFWRPASTTDPMGNSTYYTYTPTITLGTSTTRDVKQTVATGSVAETLTQLDIFGRPQLTQVKLNGTSNYNITETDYDVNGRVKRVTLPYTAVAGTLNSTVDGFTYTYDGLNRVLTEVGPKYSGSLPGPTKTYSYPSNDALVTVSPIPTGEHAKSTQTEVNGLGQVTSVCEVTSASGSASCVQSSAATGFVTTYSYYPGGKLNTITQNARGTTTQVRSFTYDNSNTGRLLTTATPESGTNTTTYDSDLAGVCPAVATGLPVKTVDNAGSAACMLYDSADRVVGLTYSPNSVTPAKTFIYDSATNANIQCTTPNQAGALAEVKTGNGPSANITAVSEYLSNGRFIFDVFKLQLDANPFAVGDQIKISNLVHATQFNGSTITIGAVSGNAVFTSFACDPCSTYPLTPDSGIATPTGAATATDEGFCYDKNGRPTDTFLWTSAGFNSYQHISESYFADGTVQSLSVPTQPTINYTLDANARVYSATASSGQTPVLTSTTYLDSGLPNVITLGTGDQSTYSYYPNLQPQSAAHTIGTSSNNTITHALTWNSNGTLASLATTDQPHTANSQSCAFSYDDFERLLTNNCGTHWNQSYAYDVFGNITKSGSAPWPINGSYNPANNRYTSTAVVYDSNGRLTNDTFDTLAWDVDGNLIQQSSTNFGYDALGRPVMAGATQYLYAPDGSLVATENSSGTIGKMYVPLPMGRAVYNANILEHYDRYDWQGSARIASTPARTLYSDTSYDAFGIPYWSSGTANNQYAGLTSDISSGSEQVSATRRYDPTQGRWNSPDSVIPNIYNPQSLNAYHYALNQPTDSTDPGGDCEDPASCPLTTQEGVINLPINIPVVWEGKDGGSCTEYGGWYCETDGKTLFPKYPALVPNTPYQEPILVTTPGTDYPEQIKAEMVYPSQQPERAAQIMADREKWGTIGNLLAAWTGGFEGGFGGGGGIQTTGFTSVRPIRTPAMTAGAADGMQSYTGGLRLTESLSKGKLSELLKDIRTNGLQDKVITYVEVGGEKYVVFGNNRVLASRGLGITNQLRFQKVTLPFQGFKTEADVINAHAEFLQGH